MSVGSKKRLAPTAKSSSSFSLADRNPAKQAFVSDGSHQVTPNRLENMARPNSTSDKAPLLGSINSEASQSSDGLVGKIKNLISQINIKLVALLLVTVFVATANRVSFKVMTNALDFHPGYLYLPVFWPITWYLMYCTNKIGPDQRAFPWWKYAIMGAFDSVAGICMVFGSAGTSGPMQQLILQGNIPLTMLCSWLMSFAFCIRIVGSKLDIRYRWTHILGAAAIVAGIIVALIPKLFFGSGAGENSIAGMIIFFFGNIPTSISGVYKEIAFRGANLDVFMVNAWVALAQTVFTPVLLPLTSLPGFSDVPLNEVPQEFWNGAKCFVGINTYIGDRCDTRMVWLHVCVYLFINIFYNIFLMMVIKFGSASLLYISSALILPMANISFTMPWIMDEFPDSFKTYSASLSVYDIVGLVVILVGLFLYRILPESDGSEPDAKAEEQEQRSTYYKQLGLDDDVRGSSDAVSASASGAGSRRSTALDPRPPEGRYAESPDDN